MEELESQIKDLLIEHNENPDQDRYGEETLMFFDNSEAFVAALMKLIKEKKVD